MTQVQLALRLGQPQSYVSKSERFERRLDVAEFRAWSIAIGADPTVEFEAASLKVASLALPETAKET